MLTIISLCPDMDTFNQYTTFLDEGGELENMTADMLWCYFHVGECDECFDKA